MDNCITDDSCVEQFKNTVLTLSEASPDMVIYQTSTMSALLSGVYEGKTTIAELLSKGNFGLGTFNQLDGELIAIDSQVYQLRADGSANRARLHQKTPFAVMTFFTPQHTHILGREMSRDDIHRLIDRVIPSDNQYCALRICGDFTFAQTRTVSAQQRPYRSMPEIVESQRVSYFEQCSGELVGFRTPRYMQGINVAGYHEHFITDDRMGGGHILDYVLSQGTLTLGAVNKIVVDIPESSDFLSANLTPDNLDTAIRIVEN
jgi:acetolactate decarboxylase